MPVSTRVVFVVRIFRTRVRVVIPSMLTDGCRIGIIIVRIITIVNIWTVLITSISHANIAIPITVGITIIIIIMRYLFIALVALFTFSCYLRIGFGQIFYSLVEAAAGAVRALKTSVDYCTSEKSYYYCYYCLHYRHSRH